jgi:hypothetical protein
VIGPPVVWLLAGSDTRWEWIAALVIVAFLVWENTPARGDLKKFRIRVYPNWEAILADHKVIPPDQVEGALRLIYSAAPSAPYSVRKDGIGFTVLEAELGYSDDHHRFFSEADIEERIPEWEQPIPDLLGKHRMEPSLYVRFTMDPIPGYELGISTPQSVSDAINKGRERDKGDRIRLATLPFLALAIHWDTTDDILNDLRQRETAAALRDFGWRREDDDPDELHAPECLKHKYFTVYHNTI